MSRIEGQEAQRTVPGLKTLVQGSLLSAASVFISMAALLVTSKLFTNALDQSQVGIFALLLVTSDFIIYASGMGLSSSMPKLVAEANPARRKEIIGSALAGQIPLLLLVGAVVLLAQQVIPVPDTQAETSAWAGVHSCLHFLPLLFIAGGLRDLILAMLAGLDRYAFRAGGIALASLAQVVLVYLFIWRGGGQLKTLTVVMALSYGIALILLWTGLGVHGKPRVRWRDYLKQVRFSFPLYLNQLMTFFNQRFDTMLVSALAGVTSAAIYEMMKKLPVLVNRVMNALLVPYLPHISQLLSVSDHAGAARVLHHAVGLSAFFGYGAVLLLTALQRPLILLLFNADYLADAAILGLLLTAASLALQSGLMAKMLIALGRNVPVPFVNMSTMLLTVGADIILIPYFGMVGAAAAVMAASGAGFFLLAAFTHRAGIPVKLWHCVKPMLFLLLSAAPLYYGSLGIVGRLLAPCLFVMLCLVFSVVTPRQLIAITSSIMPTVRKGSPCT